MAVDPEADAGPAELEPKPVQVWGQEEPADTGCAAHEYADRQVRGAEGLEIRGVRAAGAEHGEVGGRGAEGHLDKPDPVPDQEHPEGGSLHLQGHNNPHRPPGRAQPAGTATQR